MPIGLGFSAIKETPSECMSPNPNLELKCNLSTKKMKTIDQLLIEL